MIVKALEVRDAATFIPVIAIEMFPDNEGQSYLLRRAGFGFDRPLIMLVRADGRQAQYDPYSWSNVARTMPTAHQWIQDNWSDLKDGDVVCVEHILGERPEKKISERFEVFA